MYPPGQPGFPQPGQPGSLTPFPQPGVQPSQQFPGQVYPGQTGMPGTTVQPGAFQQSGNFGAGMTPGGFNNPNQSGFNNPNQSSLNNPNQSSFNNPNQSGFNTGGQTQSGFNNPAQGAAAQQMIQQMLTSPRQNPTGLGGMGGNTTMGGGIAGVATRYKGPSIKIYDERQKYQEWEFVYDPRKEAAKNMPQGPTAGQNPGNSPSGFGQPQGSQGMSSGFGQSGFGQSGSQSSFGQTNPPPPPSPPNTP